MKLGAFVTTFNRPQILKDTLARLLQQSLPPEYILVVDNGGEPETLEVVSSFPPDRVGYHRMPRNAGPAGAAAHAIPTLVEAGFDWIYCGDDDDPPLTVDTIERLMRVASEGEGPIGAVGAIGFPWDYKRGKKIRRFALPMRGIFYVDVVGGGRQLIVSSQAVARVGVPNADLFFGFEDYEYCLRIRKGGFRIAIDSRLGREYAPLISSRHVDQWYLRGRPRSEIWRQYYNTRNYIFMMRGEFGSAGLAHREAAKALVRVLRSWTRGFGYGAAFTRLQLRAIVDGYAGRLGATVAPVAKHARPPSASVT
jgi:GT2 family glycosyltransferase